ncbi:MAG TPA: sodium/solute symporter [Phycisphaerae bacterium]|nr:sodium/solute symporter [Phycisphaerae bacterium]
MLATAQQLTGMTWLDLLIIAAYGAGMLFIGWYYSKRTRSTEDYHLGGRSMRSSSIGLSLFATLLSTITYLALPGEMVNKGPILLWWMVSFPVAYVVVGYLLIPHFMRLKATSGYEILEATLGLRIRLLGAVIFLATRMLWMALIIYITAKIIIVQVMGWPPQSTPYVAVVIGLVTVVFTYMGGLRAVVLTDVIQSFLLLGGAVLCIVVISVKLGGVGAWWPTEWSPNWQHQPVFSWDPHVRATVIGSIIFMTIWWICTAGSDQMAIQRYLATRDARAARRAFAVTLGSNIVVTVVLASLGFALLGFFQSGLGHLPENMTIAKDGDKIFPYFIVHYLPPGVTGLVISGLLAAAMSSLSSGINSSGSVISVDFVDRIFGRSESEAINIRRTKIVSLIVGLVAVALSSLMGMVTGNLMEVTVRTNHVFVAPLFGLFFMAIFVPFATPLGTAVGALAGCIVAILIAYWDMITGLAPLSFQWISLIALIVNLLVAIPLSLLVPQQRRAASDLSAIGKEN